MKANAVETITFSVPLALELGCAFQAMLVQFMLNTICKHKRLRRNQKDGRTWNYCTRAELSAQFPILNADQIKRLLKKLISKGILVVGNYNKKPGDNTNWYAFKDEVKWGISSATTTAAEDLPSQENARPPDEFARPPDEFAQAIPQTYTHTYKVNDRASPSVTPSISGKKSVFKGKAKFTDEQRDVWEWLKGLGLDTSEDTLSWWARSYSLSRLDEVHREAVKRKPKSLGAYMQRLLKKAAVVVSGRVELNAEFAQCFKDLRSWHSLEIHQKYASINLGNHDIEIDFNMEPDAFRDYLQQKYQTFEQGDG